MGGFRQDPDYVTVLALEDYDDETGEAAKAAIFFRRVNQRPERPDHARTSPDEAIRLCLDARGHLDLRTIAGLLGIPADKVPTARSRAWPTSTRPPATGSPQRSTCPATSAPSSKPPARRPPPTTDADGDRWTRNIVALDKVQPADLGPEEIRAKLGAPWIPPTDIRDFAAELLGYAPTVTYLPVTAQWEVKAERGTTDTAAATAEWGTGRVDGYRLLELSTQRQGTGRLRHHPDPRWRDPGPQPGRDHPRRGEAAGPGGPVRANGYGSTRNAATGCAPSTTGGSTPWSRAVTTVRT